jgi:tetratricopeptide (TPR) repeat protein
LPYTLPVNSSSLTSDFALKLYLQPDTNSKAESGAVIAGREQQMTDSQTAAAAPAEPLHAAAIWPVKVGVIPPLADRLSTRPESAPDLAAGFSRNIAIALVPRGAGREPTDGWLQCCGKTQVAAAFAEAQWRARSVDLLLWINASSSASVLAGLAEAAAAITGTEVSGDAAVAATSLLAWLRQADQRWLAVFDDLVDGNVLTGLWPTGPTGRVLVTSSRPAAVERLPGIAVAEIGPFSPREAMSYLVGRLSADPDQRRGAMDLIEDLTCDPLALAQATAAISSSWLTCTDYRQRFVARSELIRQRNRAALRPARVTWTLSLDSADYLRPGGSAQTCLVFAALLGGHGVPVPVFTTAAGNGYIAGNGHDSAIASQRTTNSMRALEQVGLLSVDHAATPPSVWLNKVMQQAVLAATPAEMFEPAVGAAAAALLELWSGPQALTRSSPVLRASAESLRRAAGRLLWSAGCHPLMFRVGQSLDEEGLSGPAVEFWSEVAGISDSTLGPDHRDSQELAKRLATAYVAAGRRADAITWYRQLLAGWDSRFGAGSPRTLTARVRLGGVLTAAGLVDDAINMLKDTRTECERSLGPDHWLTQEAREELASAYRAAGQIAAAIRIYRRSLSERERDAGAQDAGTIATRQKLAEAYFADGKVKDALSQYKRVVTDCERSLGPDHPDTLRARASLAQVNHEAGRMATAVQIYEQVRTGTERSLGSGHRDTIAAGISLAAAYYAVGRLGDAANVYREVVQRAEENLPASDPLLKSARDGLAAITGE